MPILDTGLVEGTTMELHWAGDTDNIGVRAYRIYQDDEKIMKLKRSGAIPLQVWSQIKNINSALKQEMKPGTGVQRDLKKLFAPCLTIVHHGLIQL